MTKQAKISIITITFNAEKTLEQTILSVIKQSYKNIEYFIIDGGSTDDTLKIAAQYQPHITKLISEKDRGISHAFNKGIDLCQGDLVFLLSADDYLMSDNTLEFIASCYAANKKTDVFHGNILMLDEEKNTQTLAKPDASLKSCYLGQPIKHGATFVRLSTYKKLGGYDENYKYAMDYEFTLRLIANNSTFKYIDKCFAVIRSGGINQKFRSNTLNECFNITVRYGTPKWKALTYKNWKKTKDILKDFIHLFKLSYLLTLYRKHSN